MLPLGRENVISVVSLSAWTCYSFGMRKRMTVGECTYFPANKNTKQQSHSANHSAHFPWYIPQLVGEQMSLPYFVPL